jgi:hypothetical protein
VISSLRFVASVEKGIGFALENFIALNSMIIIPVKRDVGSLGK